MEKKSFKISGYDPIAQQALNEIRSELTTNKVYEVVIDNTCESKVGGYVSTGNTHVIHLCMGNIKRELGKFINDSQKLKEVMKVYIKNIIMGHEMTHVGQLGALEQKGQIDKAKMKTHQFESEAKKKEDWKSMEPFGLKKKMSSMIDKISDTLASKGYWKLAYRLDIISNTIEKIAYPYYDVINKENNEVVDDSEDLHLEHFSREDVQNILDDLEKGITIELPKYYYDRNRTVITHGTTLINKDNIIFDAIFNAQYKLHTLKGKGSLNPILKYNEKLHKVEPIKTLIPNQTPEQALLPKYAAAEYTQQNIGNNVSGTFSIGENTFEYAIGDTDFGMPEVRFVSKLTGTREDTEGLRGDVGGAGAYSAFKTILEIIKKWVGANHPASFFISSDEPDRSKFYDVYAKRIASTVGYTYNPKESDRVKKEHANLGVPVDKVWVLNKLQ